MGLSNPSFLSIQRFGTMARGNQMPPSLECTLWRFLGLLPDVKEIACETNVHISFHRLCPKSARFVAYRHWPLTTPYITCHHIIHIHTLHRTSLTSYIASFKFHLTHHLYLTSRLTTSYITPHHIIQIQTLHHPHPTSHHSRLTSHLATSYSTFQYWTIKDVLANYFEGHVTFQNNFFKIIFFNRNYFDNSLAWGIICANFGWVNYLEVVQWMSENYFMAFQTLR